MSPGVERQDGRRRRTIESRRRVVRALMECVAEGDFDPGAEAVAQRAGVGLRTVFRLFKDKEGLRQQMTEVVLSQIGQLTIVPLRGATWRERLDDLMTRRCSAFEQVMPFRRAAQAHAHLSPFVRSNMENMSRVMRETLVGVVQPALAADSATLEALDLALGVDAWIRLRIDQRLEPARARDVVQRMVNALIAEVK